MCESLGRSKEDGRCILFYCHLIPLKRSLSLDLETARLEDKPQHRIRKEVYLH